MAVSELLYTDEQWKQKNIKTSDDTLPGEKNTLPTPGSLERMIAERKLVRKLDMRLLPTMVTIYIMNHIDRTGITTARLKGMQEDLHISDVQYATVIAILYASYCPAQIPSNMLLNYIMRPSLYIGACAILWGLTSALTGITKDFAGILACRVFIGLPEAAFYPGAVYLFSRWYTKKELAFRTAILFSGSLMANAFGALLAAGILAKMEGILHIRAWRWLFITEGSATIFIGIASMWLLPDYPHNTRWFTQEEQRLAQIRLSEDAGEADRDTPEDSPLQGLKLAIKDPIVLLFACQTFTQSVGVSFNNYFPTLAQTLGYSTTKNLLLLVPPWALGTVFCCFNAWHAGRTRERFFHIASWWWTAVVGLILGISMMHVAGRYAAMFLMVCGYIGLSLNLVWLSDSIPRPPAKRAAAIGIVNGLGNGGSVVGSYIWKKAWGPRYHQSMVISLTAFLFSTFFAFVIRHMLVRKNKQLDADENTALGEANQTRIKEASTLEGITFEQALERRKTYRYLY